MSKQKGKQSVKPDKFLRSLYQACEYLKHRTGKANKMRRSLNILQSSLKSHRSIEAKLVVARYFNIPLENLFEREDPSPKSPEYLAILRSGFEEGAAVPGSNIRKVTR